MVWISLYAVTVTACAERSPSNPSISSTERASSDDFPMPIGPWMATQPMRSALFTILSSSDRPKKSSGALAMKDGVKGFFSIRSLLQFEGLLLTSDHIKKPVDLRIDLLVRRFKKIKEDKKRIQRSFNRLSHPPPH